MPASSEGTGADPGSALVDILADDGRVVACATRRAVRAANLLHRSVFIVVLDGSDRIVVHQRADWKDVWPSRWDLAFGGVVDAGEDWEAAAARELAEEAGIVADLVHLGDGRYSDELVREHGRVYLARSDGPFTFPDGEVAASARVGLADLATWIAERPTCPDSVAIVVPLLPGAPH